MQFNYRHLLEFSVIPASPLLGVQDPIQGLGNEQQRIDWRVQPMVVHAIHVRVWATTVFGGRGAGPGYTDGIHCLRLNRLHAFHANLMLP